MHKRSITSKSKEIAYTIITLPEAKRFMFLSCLPFFLSKTGIGLKLLFFGHNVRYGSSMTFRIGVASESLQNLDNHEPQRFDFLPNASQLNKLVNYNYYHQLKTMNIHKGTFILVSGVFLKCFSICSRNTDAD